MKTPTKLAALLLLFTINPQLSTAFAQNTAFTYQGQLKDSGTNANGSYTMILKLYYFASASLQNGFLISWLLKNLMRIFRRSGIASSKAVKSSWLLCVVPAGIVIFSTSLLQAQLVNVDFNNNSYGAGHGGPSPGQTMSGAAVLGATSDQWNGINVNSGTGIPLIYANGSNSPVTRRTARCNDSTRTEATS